MFVQDRDTGRRIFFEIWRKYQEKLTVLEPLEELILGVILDHTEYHPLLQDPDSNLGQEFTPEMGQSNPFLHMGMHIAIQEQVSTDRPTGITILYQQLLKRSSDRHGLEHRMMECLGESLWLAQRNNTMPDEAAYLECLKGICP